MCETKLDKNVKPSEFLPSNYNGCIREDRTSNGGGVMIALKLNYIVDEVELSADCEIVWAKLTLKNNHSMYIGSFYRPPSDTNTESLQELEKSTDVIMEACRNNTQAAIILGSDFNADGINWDTCSILPDCKKKSICEKIIDIFDKCGLSQLQTAPTRMGATLDLFATNKPGLVKNINNIPGIADHDTLLIDSDIQARSSKKPPITLHQDVNGPTVAHPGPEEGM